MSWFEEQGDDLILRLRVTPRAARDEIQGIHGEMLKIRVQAPPVEGKANARLIKFLSKQWNIPRASLRVLSGETDRNKRVRLLNPSTETRIRLLSLENE